MGVEVVEAARGVFGDVLGERARLSARGEDARHGVVVEGAVRARVAERGAQVVGRVAGAQEQELAGVVAGEARRRGGEAGEEGGGVLAHVVEGLAQLVEVGAVPVPWRVDPLRVDVEPRAPPRQLVARDAAQVGGVHEELALRHAHRQDVGHVVIRHRVLVAVPGDEAVDGADAVDDARGVVRVQRQRHEFARLLGEDLEPRALELLVGARVTGGALPLGELGAHVVEVVEVPAVEEALFEFPKTSFDPRFVVGVTGAARLRPKLVVGGEGEEARVVERLLPLPAEHDGLLAVVLARAGGAAETLEALDVPVGEREGVSALVEPEALARRVAEHVREDLHGRARPVGEVDRVRRPVRLGHLAGRVHRRRLRGFGAFARPDLAHVRLDRGVAAGEAGRAQLLEDALTGDLRVACEQRGDPLGEGRELALARRARRPRRQRRLRRPPRLLVRDEQLTDRVAADRQRPGDRPAREALLAERDGLVRQLLARDPRRHGVPFR